MTQRKLKEVNCQWTEDQIQAVKDIRDELKSPVNPAMSFAAAFRYLLDIGIEEYRRRVAESKEPTP